MASHHSHALLAALAGSLMFVSSRASCLEDMDVPVLPKVPLQATIVGGTKADDEKVDLWIAKLIEAKEKRANQELEKIKKELIAEERERQAEERERRRREQRQEEAFGTLGPVLRVKDPEPIHIKLDFLVPEIYTYNKVIKALEKEQSLAREIVDALTRLDRDGDNQLTQDEYRDAGAIVSSTKRMFEKLDGDNDGLVSELELDSVIDLPKNVAEAIEAGRTVADASNFRIKPFDVKDEQILDVGERKTLTMAYVDIALRAEQDAAFYRQLVLKITNARNIVAEKFADIEIKP